MIENVKKGAKLKFKVNLEISFRDNPMIVEVEEQLDGSDLLKIAKHKAINYIEDDPLGEILYHVDSVEEDCNKRASFCLNWRNGQCSIKFEGNDFCICLKKEES